MHGSATSVLRDAVLFLQWMDMFDSFLRFRRLLKHRRRSIEYLEGRGSHPDTDDSSSSDESESFFAPIEA